MEKKLYKNTHNKAIGGVCSGLAEYFNMDPSVLRLLFVVFAFFSGGTGVLVYIVLWIVLPAKAYEPFTNPSDPFTVNYIVPPVMPPSTPGTPFVPVPPKKQNNSAGIIIGAILIVVGAMALLHQYNVFFFWHLHHWLVPIVLVAVGISLIIKGQQKQPWERKNWHENKPVETPEPVKPETVEETDHNPITE